MSNDHALFIIVVPNDFDLETSTVPITTTTTNISKQESALSSINTLSALMVPAFIPLSAPPSITSSTGRKSEPELFPERQRPSSLSICVLLKNYLTEKSDIEPVWMISEDKKIFQITFYVEFGLVSDHMLQNLIKLGIGKRYGTKISVLPTTILLKGSNNERRESSLSSLNLNYDINNIIANSSLPIIDETNQISANGSPSNDHTLSNKKRKHIHKSEFKKSVRARIMVHQVVASIRASSAISFDFILLICLASMLAAFGLLENSTVIIVASMLVSPLMNPIMGIVFGLSVRDHSLSHRGLRNEIIGLIICISCGFLLGLFTTFFETKWGSSSSFPTSEMRSRGDVKRLWVGVLIALPSGAGVALSVLGGNTGSLVGVAISASLLPPAVNCGLLFAYGLLGKIFSNVAAIQSSPLNTTNQESYSSLNCKKYINNNYIPLYTCNLSDEAAILACCSLLLTIVNIICIIIMALIILRIKEVVPLHQPNKDIANFFHYDVKAARDYNKTIHEGDFSEANLTTATLNRRNNLAQSIVNRWKTFKSSTIQQPTQLSSLSLNIDLESTNHINNLISNNTESQRKLFRLKTFAKEYDLDLFNKGDYDLTNSGSQEKVCFLVSDLIDMCQEIPSVFIDLYRLQPSSTHISSIDKEHLAFYQEIIEILPPKWYQLFKYERQRRHIPWPLTFNRSYSMRSPREETYNRAILESNDNNLSEALKKQNKKDRTYISRQSSVPESKRPSITIHEETDIPIEGTRFRITKPTTTTEIVDNELKLI